ncbi:alpha/beta hydrolase family protein [Herbiconiux sp. SYSU D00978]|uniref:alpha/beta hydrolase family protein n=1 Tax=Herbiconiux sp. SYSU D00978 TaxID=2812562 RepID=UPI001A959934|nr:alpha/beta fold hydrolase [Herbiconiux sp. SYSU D00978]
MTHRNRHAAGPGRGGDGLRRAVALGAAGVAGVAGAAVAATLGAGVVAARTVITPPTSRRDDTAILAVDQEHGLVTLEASEAAAIDGRYSLWFERDTGHAKIGEIVAREPARRGRPASVTRRLLSVDVGELQAARRGRIGAWYHLSPADLGVPHEDVGVPTTLGPAPAWLVPAERPGGRWVIQVHGWGVQRAEGLRAVPVFRRAGYTCLLISYRNDGIAPSTPDGRYGLGDTEWLDVEAAIRFARDRGATEIVLMGWSMGGAIVLQTVTRSRLAHDVRGIVLESPVVDWVTALHFQGSAMHLPRSVRHVVFALLGSRWGRIATGLADPVDLRRLNFMQRADELAVPTLVLHSDDDAFVPSTASHALATARPDLVELPEWHTAGHTRLWNLHPERWEGQINAWLDRLP